MSIFKKIKFYIRQFPLIYPRRIINSCKSWIDQENNEIIEFGGVRRHWYRLKEDIEFHINPLPNTHGADRKNNFDNNVVYKTANATLFLLKNCFLFRSKGLVLTNQHKLFKEFSHNFYGSSLKRFIYKNPFYTFSNSYTKMNGVGASLISPESHNYYHFLFDVIPRIKLYQEILPHIDLFCVSDKVPQKFLEILPIFGISKDKILLVNDNEKIQFDNLYVTSLIGSEGRSPKWAIDFLRVKLIAELSPAKTRKIYFKRGDNRKIINEDQVIEVLKKYGFDVVDPDNLSIIEQAQLMQTAHIVVSGHGASLSNLLFCQEGCKVIEIFSPDYFRTDCFYTLAGQLKLAYWYILGDKAANNNWGDCSVSEEVLEKTIKTLIG